MILLTSSANGGRGGSVLAPDFVAPAHFWVPEHVSTAGPEVAELAAMAGIYLDAEQRIVLDAFLSETSDGRWAAFECCHIEGRQNGKTVLLEAIALADLFLFDNVQLVIWTAHLVATAQKAFRDLMRIIEAVPHFRRRVAKTIRANGKEGFVLRDGRELQVRARSAGSGRGFTGDRIIFDEAFAISPDELGALIPTLSTRPNPQVIYASSAGHLKSEFLRDVRDRGRKGGDPSLAYIEWCAPPGGCADPKCGHYRDTPGCVLDDPERWRPANHTLDRRITRTNILAERHMLPPDEFARERLGWWQDPVAGMSGVPADGWEECADRDAELGEPVVLAVDVAPGHSAAAIVACAGPLHVVDHHRGTGWVVARLLELREAHQVVVIGLDPAGPAGALIPDLEAEGLKVRDGKGHGTVVLLDGRQQVQACEGFLAAVLDRSLVHRDQLVLNSAVVGAGRRQVGDSWKWSRRDSTADISPLVAATVARWLWVNSLGDEADRGVW